MNTQDRAAIDGIFGRLQEVESQSPPRDAEADAFIRARIDAHPSYAYYLAQTVAVQDDALKTAQQKIADLEQKLAAAPAAAQSGSSFMPAPTRLDSFFGRSAGRSTTPAGEPLQPSAPPAYEPPPPPAAARPGFGGGGFLAGAAQTAMGVAGGMMLGSMLGGLFGGHEAHAAAPTPTPPAEPAHVADTSNDSGDYTGADSNNVDYDAGNLFDDNNGGFDDSGFDDV